MRVVTTAVLAGVLLAGAGCGGDDDPADSSSSAPSSAPSSSAPAPSAPPTPRSDVAPSIDEIALSLIAGQSGNPEETYTKVEATCVAKILHESALSDQALSDIEEDLPGFRPTGADDTAFRSLVPLITTCVTGRLSTATPTPTPTP